MKRLPVLAFAAAMAIWGLASIPAGSDDSSATITGVKVAALAFPQSPMQSSQRREEACATCLSMRTR
jgi:hypothetical protein